MNGRLVLGTAALAALVLAGCAETTSTSSTTTVDVRGGPRTSPFPAVGVAIASGDAANANVKNADFFDPVAGTFLGATTTLVPGPHTHVQTTTLSNDGRTLYFTASDTNDPSHVAAGVYALDLTTDAARYVASLGSGIPVDASISPDGRLLVLVADASATTDERRNRIVAIDAKTETGEVFGNPLPADAEGRRPVPLAIIADPSRRLVYLTDGHGAISALRLPGLKYYRTLPGTLPTFSALQGSAVLDLAHSLIYQLGSLETMNDRQQETAVGAVLRTSIGDGGTQLTSFPYIPVPGALLDPTGGTLWFASTFAPSVDEPNFLTRIDLDSKRVIGRPILRAYGRPEFLTSAHLARSSDGAHILVPVSTGAADHATGALLEFDPTTLILQRSIAAPDDFQSGGVVAN